MRGKERLIRTKKKRDKGVEFQEDRDGKDKGWRRRP